MNDSAYGEVSRISKQDAGLDRFAWTMWPRPSRLSPAAAPSALPPFQGLFGLARLGSAGSLVPAAAWQSE